MTWVIGIAGAEWAALIADVRVCWRKSGRLTPLSFGVQKIFAFSQRTAVRLASDDVDRAWAALDSLHDYMASTGRDNPQLRKHLENWIGRIKTSKDELSRQGASASLLFLRTSSMDVVGAPLMVSRGCVLRLPSNGQDFSISDTPWLQPGSIGSGADVPRYRAALEGFATKEWVVEVGNSQLGVGFRGHLAASF